MYKKQYTSNPLNPNIFPKRIIYWNYFYIFENKKNSNYENEKRKLEQSCHSRQTNVSKEIYFFDKRGGGRRIFNTR
jgi:hypothetical protein